MNPVNKLTCLQRTIAHPVTLKGVGLHSGDDAEIRLCPAPVDHGVVFHRVIEGFMAQTGDVKFGNSEHKDYDLKRAGMGGSDLPDLKAEFNDLPHERGTLSMARSADPNSANSQFFICFEPAPFLDRQYTVFGKVIDGMNFVDNIKRGDSNNNGSVDNPDKIISFKSD